MSGKTTSRTFSRPQDVDLSKVIYQIPKEFGKTFDGRVNMFYETEGNYMVFNIVGYSEFGVGFWSPKDKPIPDYPDRNYRITMNGPEPGWYLRRLESDPRNISIVKIENNAYVEIPPENYTPRTKNYLEWIKLMDTLYTNGVLAVLEEPMSKRYKRTKDDVLWSYPCRPPEKSTDRVTGGPLEISFFRISASHVKRVSKSGKDYNPTVYFDAQRKAVEFEKYRKKSARCFHEIVYCPTSIFFTGSRKEAYITSRANQCRALTIGGDPEKASGGARMVQIDGDTDIYNFEGFDYETVPNDDDDGKSGDEGGDAKAPDSPGKATDSLDDPSAKRIRFIQTQDGSE